jgi:hypothetical protein
LLSLAAALSPKDAPAPLLASSVTSLSLTRAAGALTPTPKDLMNPLVMVRGPALA